MKLLVDFGNTRLKWATFESGAAQPGGVFAHAGGALAAALGREWSAIGGVDAVLVASVVAPGREEELGAFVQGRFGFRATFLRSPAAALGVRNGYAEPARLGIDRFLALAAAHAQRARAQVVASAGTALTVDVLGADGVHGGGIIVPGPRLMREAVLAGTARVGAGEGRLRDLPDNTADALASGSRLAAAGAVDRCLATAAEHFGCRPALVLTGGGADEIAPLLPEAERAHDLVLHGLALWAAAHG